MTDPGPGVNVGDLHEGPGIQQAVLPVQELHLGGGGAEETQWRPGRGHMEQGHLIMSRKGGQ